MGTETEYGITCPDGPSLSPIITSTHAVVAYAAMRTTARSRWDYEAEHPLKDARGFDLKRYHTVPVVDANAMGVANVVTANGARFYVDHAHPEYSSPEVSNAWDAMIYDAAGDIVLNDAAAIITDLHNQQVSVLKDKAPCPPLKFYKNNVDGKGASYGSHENYQYSRHTDFGRLAQALIPFFVTRQVLIGAGRVGIGQESEREGFQISQRADYVEQQISLETTLNRGIINTRDEPHADETRFRRLHVIVGDANMSQYSTFLKLGMTKLVLDAIEAGVDFSDLALKDPVAEIRAVSHDPTCRHELVLDDARRMSAIDILRVYRSRVVPGGGVDKRVLELWGELLDDLERDPLSTADRLDWTAKYALVLGYLRRGVDIADPKLKALDLQYADIDPASSLHHALVCTGRMKTLASPDAIARAAAHPPEDSRAYLRGMLSTRFGERVLASNWQSVLLETERGPVRLQLDDVNRFGRAEVGELIEKARSVDEVLDALAGRL
ncbi:depupylase/deamidase Dop [Corynebacterium liangguodongii]|uniref:Proteasome accessory factor PafA2 n=1 Tax=Corynebacterium liangguodongii TaxID=2079535 RepID=A0A2S0WE01_9CORY|nr:depupylase/deamidase Dop [Corynebacterium liangguodongii]AWB84003.1 proteasome accessory factor PafA2 [Corynebacterium liangguodongii]PWC00015.1 proteasome accessory factor PafA2 [Corynebacterium liangguodongii]